MPKTTAEHVVTIYHDPFGRCSLVRRLENCGTQCPNCGQPSRFRYGVERDDRPYDYAWDKKCFCSVGCRRSYYA